MRESLMKLAEVAKPVPGDEQDFVAKHGMKIMDFQGKDSISQESPYELMLKNLAVVKKPGDPGKDDHGHDAPGESEAAYHIPESREEKIAKLSQMMEATINPKEQQLADALKSLLAETFSLYLKAHHYHWNVMGPDFAQYHDFLGELYQEVHGAVDMIAENIRVLGELAPGNLGAQDVSMYTDPHLMVVDLMMDNEKVLRLLNSSYKLAESMDRLGISNFLQDRLTAHEKHHWMMQAIAGVKGEKPIEEAKKQVVGVEMHYKHATKKPFKITHFSVQDAERGRKEYEKMGYKLVGKKAQMGEEAERVNEVKAVKAYDKEGKLVGRYRSMDHAKQMKPGHTYKVEEEVEQVDELKTSTLKSYLDKRPAPKLRDIARPETVGKPEERQKDIDRANLTRMGRARAKARITKAEPPPPPHIEPVPMSSRFDEGRDYSLSYGSFERERKQKAIARDLLAREMQKRREERAAKKQAGTMKLKEEDRREVNDKAREERLATPRPNTPETVEAMRHRLQSIKKQIIDKT